MATAPGPGSATRASSSGAPYVERITTVLREHGGGSTATTSIETAAPMALPTTVGGLGTAGEMRMPASASAQSTANKERTGLRMPPTPRHSKSFRVFPADRWDGQKTSKDDCFLTFLREIRLNYL